MPTTSPPYGQRTQRQPALVQIDILWLTAGLGCDGDSISMTAATQPSIEDIVLGAIPGSAQGRRCIIRSCRSRTATTS